jgi:hypothetical protein
MAFVPLGRAVALTERMSRSAHMSTALKRRFLAQIAN